jgi:hypothetical protein
MRGKTVTSSATAILIVRSQSPSPLTPYPANGRSPTARKPMRTCFALSGLSRIGGVPRAALRFALGYLILPLWGG